LVLVIPADKWDQVDASGKSPSQIAEELGLLEIASQLRKKSML
jgi:hypothetical protein